MSIFALYNVNKHSMPRQKREKSGTGICHVMQGKESKTCPYDSLDKIPECEDIADAILKHGTNIKLKLMETTVDAITKKHQEEQKGRRKMITNE